MRIRLTRKLAGRLNGIDASNQQVGDIMEHPDKAAAMLIAEGWTQAVAEPVPAQHPPNKAPLRDITPGQHLATEVCVTGA